jgi:hypothetical protein
MATVMCTLLAFLLTSIISALVSFRPSALDFNTLTSSSESRPPVSISSGWSRVVVVAAWHVDIKCEWQRSVTRHAVVSFPTSDMMDKRVRRWRRCVCVHTRARVQSACACARQSAGCDCVWWCSVRRALCWCGWLDSNTGMDLLRGRVDAPLPSASARAKISLHVCKKYSRVPVSPAIVLLTTPDVLECQHGLRFTQGKPKQLLSRKSKWH